MVLVVVAAACGGTTEPPPAIGPSAIARFENLPSDTALDVLDDLALTFRAVDTKGAVITDLTSLIAITVRDPRIASVGTVNGASATISGNAFGTSVLTITASNSNVPGAAPVTATITVKVRPHPILIDFPAGVGHVEIYGVADDGSVGGAAYARQGINGAMAWRYTPGGGPERLKNLGSQEDLSQVRGVAGNGTMVGYSSSKVTRWSSAGVPTDIGPSGIATGVNNSGAILYYASVRTPNGGGQNQPFYRAPNGEVTSLGTLGGGEAIGWDLADDGGVTGNVVRDGPRPFYWTLQGTTMIPVPTGFGDGNGIANGGRVVGTFSYGPGFSYSKGYYWSPTEGLTELAGFGTDEYVDAQDVNDAGLVVGSSANVATAEKPYRTKAYVWSRATGFVDLTGKLPRPTRAFAISNSGVVAGTMQTATWSTYAQNEQAVIWILRRP